MLETLSWNVDSLEQTILFRVKREPIIAPFTLVQCIMAAGLFACRKFNMPRRGIMELRVGKAKSRIVPTGRIFIHLTSGFTGAEQPCTVTPLFGSRKESPTGGIRIEGLYMNLELRYTTPEIRYRKLHAML